MSEPVLNAILRLFAIVAKEDQVTQQERDYILAFLNDHLGRKAVMEKMAFFDDFAKGLSDDQEKMSQPCARSSTGKSHISKKRSLFSN
ncbi:MAG TPA: hypothetical protein VG737_08025 [Cyclobacteriaceae bacterium]|nr:hypothetical protein [Cyclobacteriaceae bacterium]